MGLIAKIYEAIWPLVAFSSRPIRIPAQDDGSKVIRMSYCDYGKGTPRGEGQAVSVFLSELFDCRSSNCQETEARAPRDMFVQHIRDHDSIRSTAVP